MSSTRTTVDKNSCDAEIEPSVVRVEGTVDHLNEAPLCELCQFQTTRPVFLDDGHVIGFCCVCDHVTEVGSLTLRDGQPR